MKIHNVVVSVVLGMALSGGVLAADSQAGAGARWSVALGGFDAQDSDGHFPRENGGGFLAVGFGVAQSENLRLDLELSIHNRVYDAPAMAAPLFTTVDDSMTVATVGISGLVRGQLPSGPVTWFIGAGPGVFSSSAMVTGETLGLSGAYDERSGSLGAQFLLGADIAVGEKLTIGAELRRLWLKGDFGAISQGKTDIGGGVFALTLRGSF